MSELIKIIASSKEQGTAPKFVRTENVAWRMPFPMTARSIGRTVAADLDDYFDHPTDDRVRGICMELAAQEPPLATEASWNFYDGVREFLEDRRSYAELAKQSQGEQNV